MRKTILAAAVSVSVAGVVAPLDVRAAEPDYLDDRSDAEAVVKSFYNAINRREFSRAWSYFGESKPSANFESFVTGFEDTKSVRVVTGEPGAEGAAGSTYFNVPVAIAATGADDTERVFAGCYTARLANSGAAVHRAASRARRPEANRQACRGSAPETMRRGTAASGTRRRTRAGEEGFRCKPWRGMHFTGQRCATRRTGALRHQVPQHRRSRRRAGGAAVPFLLRVGRLQ
jgi:hypothetical protein